MRHEIVSVHEHGATRLSSRSSAGYFENREAWVTAFEAAPLIKPPALRGVSDAPAEKHSRNRRTKLGVKAKPFSRNRLAVCWKGSVNERALSWCKVLEPALIQSIREREEALFHKDLHTSVESCPER